MTFLRRAAVAGVLVLIALPGLIAVDSDALFGGNPISSIGADASPSEVSVMLILYAILYLIFGRE